MSPRYRELSEPTFPPPPSPPMPRLPITEQLRRANPTVDGPTYRVITGQITDAEYRAALNEERVRYGLPPLDPDPLYVPEPDTHGTGRPVLGVVFLLLGAVAGGIVVVWMWLR